MVVREATITYRSTGIVAPISRLNTPEAAQAYAALVLPDNDAREHFIVIALNTRHGVLAHKTISIGTVDASLVHPREVFAFAVMAGASSIVLAHTHPSGDPTPSNTDLDLTKRMVAAGTLMGVAVLDHVIVGNSYGDSLAKRTYSMRGAMPLTFLE